MGALGQFLASLAVMAMIVLIAIGAYVWVVCCVFLGWCCQLRARRPLWLPALLFAFVAGCCAVAAKAEPQNLSAWLLCAVCAAIALDCWRT